MQALRAKNPAVRFAGVGGPRMEEEGLQSLFPMRDLAVMGLVEILPRIHSLSARLTQAVAHIEAVRPDLVVTIDSPGLPCACCAVLRLWVCLECIMLPPKYGHGGKNELKNFRGCGMSFCACYLLKKSFLANMV